MKKISKSLFMWSMLSLMPCLLLAQKNYVKNQARKAYNLQAFASAFDWSSKVLELEEDNIEFMHMAGRSAYEIRAFEEASLHLSRVMNSREARDYPEAYLLAAESNFILRNYDKVINYTQRMIDEQVGSPEQQNQAILLLENCEWAMEEWNNCSDNITLTKLDGINTSKSDFPISYSNQYLQFVSLHETISNNTCNCKDPCTFEMRWARLNTSVNQKDSVTIPGPTNKMSHFTYSTGNHRIYYSGFDCNKNDGAISAIYYREQQVNGGWSDPVRLPNHINTPGYSSKQPFLAAGDRPGVERLYFVSDKPGGKGGWDLYFTEIKDDRFGTAFNLGAANTAGDEVTPYFHNETQKLYFSSNSYTEGMNTLGGMDVFEIQKIDDNEWLQAHNLGCNVNSSWDETYYILDEENCQAYFSSTREDALTDNAEDPHCCPDIYQVSYTNEVNVIVKAYDNCGGDRIPLPGVAVQLNDISGGQNNTLGSNFDPDQTEYVFEDISLDLQLEAVGTKEGYIRDDSTGNTNIKTCRDTAIIIELYFKKVPTVELVTTVWDKVSSEIPISADELILEEFADPPVEIERRKVAEGALKNQYTFTLEVGKLYRIKALKNGYVADPEFGAIVNTRNLASNDCQPNILERNLYLLNPLPLYFFNDTPDRNKAQFPYNYRRDTIAKGDYDYYFRKYLTQEQGFIDSTCVDEPEDVSQLFEDLQKAKDRLDELATIMIQRLDENNSDGSSRFSRVNVTISGFASPSGNSDYNVYLSYRRASSIEQYMKRFFREQDREDYQDKLNVKVNPNGDREGLEKDVCKGPKCCSTYGVAASRQRRVEITDITFE